MGLVDKIAAAERNEAIHHTQGEVTTEIRHAIVPDVIGTIAKVVADCDPMGFLEDVVNGKAIESHTVIEDKEGNLLTTTLYTTPTLAQRISVARYLGNKYMPNVSVSKIITDKPPTKPDAPKSHYDQIMDHAASAANAKDVTPTPQQPATQEEAQDDPED
ncbi:MAG: hypothetical protein V3W37_08965 [Candidatus Binatia bacterium]